MGNASRDGRIEGVSASLSGAIATLAPAWTRRHSNSVCRPRPAASRTRQSGLETPIPIDQPPPRHSIAARRGPTANKLRQDSEDFIIGEARAFYGPRKARLASSTTKQASRYPPDRRLHTFPGAVRHGHSPFLPASSSSRLRRPCTIANRRASRRGFRAHACSAVAARSRCARHGSPSTSAVRPHPSQGVHRTTPSPSQGKSECRAARGTKLDTQVATLSGRIPLYPPMPRARIRPSIADLARRDTSVGEGGRGAMRGSRQAAHLCPRPVDFRSSAHR